MTAVPRAWPSRHRLASLLGVLLAGCVYPRLEPSPPPTAAVARAEDTYLGLAFRPGIEAHPGTSGMLPLADGLDAFAARVALIDRAERAVDLQVYILHDDVTGRAVLGRLLAAADRDVRVRLLLDDLGSSGIDELVAAADAHPGLEVRLFNPFARGPSPGLARALDFASRPRRLNHRMHNKLLAVDGSAGIVGGRNIGDEYFAAHEDVNFADLDLFVVGPVVQELGESFDLYWNSPYAVPVSAWDDLQRAPQAAERLRQELDDHLDGQRDSPYAERLRSASFVQAMTAGHLELLWAPVRAVADLPRKVEARGADVAETLLMTRLRDHLPPAQSELLIVSPYFVPRASGVEFLTGTAAQGVRVAVLTNSLAATDVSAVHAGYAPWRRRLLEASVELYELRPSSDERGERERRASFGSSRASLHAKTFCIDRRIVFVGSMNLDPRSVDHNTEIGLLVESSELAQSLASGFERIAAPDLCWRLALEPSGPGQCIAWHGTDGGQAIEHRDDPDVSWWAHVKVAFLGLLPIDGQL